MHWGCEPTHKSGDAAGGLGVHLPQCLPFTVITFPSLDKPTLWQVMKVLEQGLTHFRDFKNPFLVTVTFKESKATSYILK